MAYEMKPLSCSPSQLKGFSEKLIVSHYENNYGGAVKLGTASILIGAGALGVLLFHSRAKGALALCAVIAGAAVFHLGFAPVRALPLAAGSGGLFDIGAFFLTVGAFSFGGGLSMIAFIQDQVVNLYQWLTQREFIDGLALGQLTPGPILMVSAYVGYKLAGIAGAALATAAIFLPAFILMLSILPIFDRVRQVVWMKAAVKGISPAVIGVLLVTLAQMAPHALPDPVAGAIFALAAAALLGWNVGPLKLMLAGALRERLSAFSFATR